MKLVPGYVVDEMQLLLLYVVGEQTFDRLQNILQIEMMDVDLQYGYVLAGAPEMLVPPRAEEKVVHQEQPALPDSQMVLSGDLQTAESKIKCEITPCITLRLDLKNPGSLYLRHTWL